MAKLTQDEPVLIVGLVGAALSYLASFLVTDGIITDTEASTATKVIVPPIAALLVIVLAFIARHLVAPYAKVKRTLERAGLMTDADFARIETIVHSITGVDLTPEPPAEPIGDVPDGMGAGVP